ncbi:uncharacterized protein V1516DRAFT_625930 [Lipomyces oligophaga]|uniref:uncharacterized protein n=1 Tax=Lipomyces oligophaga TaxID=45792 RepID=UPI0034CF71FD
MSAQKYEFVVIIPDQADANTRRIGVRQAHLENVRKLFAEGILSSGGAYLDGPIVEGETPSFRGSVVTIIAESKEQVIEIMKSDPYTTAEVWDWEKAQIFNFACAVRQAKP